MELWPHQILAIQQVSAAILEGVRRILLCIPTGGGKTKVAEELIRLYLDEGRKVCLYTNRRLLIEQTSRVMAAAGHDHGVRAANYADDRHKDFQVASIQTEAVRSLKTQQWELHEAELVILDEAHLNCSPTVQRILQVHHDAGAAIVGLTATPIGLAGIYDRLIVAGSPSELRACGALVLAHHYGPDQPDLKDIKTPLGEDLTEKQAVKAMMRNGIFGRVMGWFDKLNPAQTPTLLFAPGVKESAWFAEQFTKAGIRAAHIDGAEVWVDGEWHRTGRSIRKDVLDRSESGDIKIICNRFVLREGIDAPWIEHLILATVMGSLQTYLQTVGRGLRASPSTGKTHLTIQDHGGCLDSETEILTLRGWVGRTQIQDDDQVAAFDRETGEMSWQPILHRHDRPLGSGEQMFGADGRSCSIRVTGNHRLLNKKRTCTPTNEPVWPSAFRLQRADELALSKVRFKIPVAGIQQAPRLPLTDDEIRFIGWFVTDGHKGRRAAVNITQANHQPHIADLRKCLAGCGFDFREYQRMPTGFPGSKPQTAFMIPKGNCPARPRRGWERLEAYLEKNLSPLMEAMDRRQFEIFLHAVHLGDGAKGVGPGRYRISTGNRTFADRLQSLCVRRGWRCNVHVQKPCDSSGKGGTLVVNAIKTDHLILHGFHAADGQTRLKCVDAVPGERVWCVANPLETLVVRRKGKVCIIGNSWLRHGSANEDREWLLEYTAGMVSGLREDRLRTKKQRQPQRCPQCARIIQGHRCQCGYEIPEGKKTRPVVQSDGTLRELRGDAFRPRQTFRRPNGPALWKRMYFRSCTEKGERTFRAAMALFAQENHWQWPQEKWPWMPTRELDAYRLVKDVPREFLVPE